MSSNLQQTAEFILASKLKLIVGFLKQQSMLQQLKRLGEDTVKILHHQKEIITSKYFKSQKYKNHLLKL